MSTPTAPTGVIRLVSPQPTVSPVLLPPAGLPHSWGPLSQVLAVVLQVQAQVCVYARVGACACVRVTLLANLVLIPCNHTRISCIVKSHDTWVIDRDDAASQHKPRSSVQWCRNGHSSVNKIINKQKQNQTSKNYTITVFSLADLLSSCMVSTEANSESSIFVIILHTQDSDEMRCCTCM